MCGGGGVTTAMQGPAAAFQRCEEASRRRTHMGASGDAVHIAPMCSGGLSSGGPGHGGLFGTVVHSVWRHIFETVDTSTTGMVGMLAGAGERARLVREAGEHCASCGRPAAALPCAERHFFSFFLCLGRLGGGAPVRGRAVVRV